ncbi:T9SS type A sorting domain-containing protein [candidate division KSB1 bacterium]|nr:T9SS type A sorting domain-containing protein [candidate division KSB1 bacterium]
MLKKILFYSSFLFTLLSIHLLFSQTEAQIRAKFLKRTHVFQGTVIPYRLFVPETYNPAQRYPLVLALHGAGERGNDNEAHIRVHRLATAWGDTINQRHYPCFVVAPQCPANQRWVDNDWSKGDYRVDQIPISNEMQTVVNLLDSLQREFSVDSLRLYVTGLSMGGYGTWDLIARFPKRFAAAIPMSGGGDSTKVKLFAHLPIWDFHGEADFTVPATGSRQMITALERIGKTCIFTHYNFKTRLNQIMPDSVVRKYMSQGADLFYTEYKGAGHVMWEQAYNNPQLIDWVFAKTKAAPSAIDFRHHPVPVVSFELLQNYPNPFNPTTTISYSIQAPTHIILEIFNQNGQRIAELVNQPQSAGSYDVTFEARELGSGTYFYQIRANGMVQSRKMILVK